MVRRLSSVEFKLLEMPKVAVQLAQTGSSRRIHSRPEPIYHQRKESLLDLDCVTQEASRESLSPPMVITQLAPPRQPEVELKITLMQRNLGDTEEGVGGTAGGLTSRPHSSGSSHDSLNEASMQQHTQIQNAVYSSYRDVVRARAKTRDYFHHQPPRTTRSEKKVRFLDAKDRKHEHAPSQTESNQEERRGAGDDTSRPLSREEVPPPPSPPERGLAP